jgi:hypothetical protein
MTEWMSQTIVSSVKDTLGDHAVVLVEVPGGWYDAIGRDALTVMEHCDAPLTRCGNQPARSWIGRQRIGAAIQNLIDAGHTVAVVQAQIVKEKSR